MDSEIFDTVRGTQQVRRISIPATPPPEAHQRIVTQRRRDLVSRVTASPTIREWLRTRRAFCFYGPNQPARMVQVTGLADAFSDLGVPFAYVAVGKEASFAALLRHCDEIVLLTSVSYLARIERLTRHLRCRVILIPRPYNDDGDVPDPERFTHIQDDEIAALERMRDSIVLVASEFSPEGNERYYRGYADRHGIPVMTFSWGVNVIRHYPLRVPLQADLVFLGTYVEKSARIDAYFGPLLGKYRSTVMGIGWSLSPFPFEDSILADFDAAAPQLYSSHAVSLNLHQDWEFEGFTCNERNFNVIACGGFLVTDDAPRLRNYFADDEIVIASSPEAYIDAVAHFVAHPDDRLPYMKRAQTRVFSEHTYHQRLADLLFYLFEGHTLSPYCPVLES